MRYTHTVRVFHQTGRHGRLRYWFGGMLCWLLLLYAVGAKLALYQPQQPEAKSVAATKAWQNNAIPTLESGPVRQASLFFDILAALLSLVLMPVCYTSLDEPVMSLAAWFSPPQSIRPPPVL